MRLYRLFSCFKGQYCGWHRATVIGIESLNTLKVYYNDYGTKGIVCRQHCRYLLEKFAELPSLAIQASLAGILPKKKHRNHTRTSIKTKSSSSLWSKGAIERFRNFNRATNYCTTVGIVCQVINRKPLSLAVYDTVTNCLPRGEIANEVLVREGFVVKDPNALLNGRYPWDPTRKKAAPPPRSKVGGLQSRATTRRTVASTIPEEDTTFLTLRSDIVKFLLKEAERRTDAKNNTATNNNEDTAKDDGQDGHCPSDTSETDWHEIFVKKMKELVTPKVTGWLTDADNHFEIFSEIEFLTASDDGA